MENKIEAATVTLTEQDMTYRCGRCGEIFPWNSGHDCVAALLRRIEKLEKEISSLKIENLDIEAKVYDTIHKRMLKLYCVHEKVYSNEVLTSNPPQRRWICSKCGDEGTSFYTESLIHSSTSDYAEIKAKFLKEEQG